MTTISRWQDQAVCVGKDTAAWYPERGTANNHGRDAKSLCAACPVAAHCLEHALTNREKKGIWGGASERRRRSLHAAFLQRRHDYQPDCRRQSCWCRTIDDHLANLRGERVQRVVLNGPNATCGLRSTYARGCREGRCMLAISVVGQRLAATGVDLADWWHQRFGDHTDSALVDVAKMLAERELEQVAAA